jgi:3-oxoadipate enol-lactonase
MLAYTEAGSGRTIVLLHGFPLNRSIWKDQVAALKGQYRVITPDLPGHGESPAFPEGGPATMGRMAGEVLALLDHLRIGVFAVAGHSMGGYVALALQKAVPGRMAGLGLISSQAGPDSPEVRENRLVLAAKAFQHGAGVVAEAMMPKLFGPSVSPDSAIGRQVTAIMEATSMDGIRGALLGMAEREDMRTRLTGITAPTLILTGDQDRAIPMERSQCMAANMGGAVLVKVAGAGHMPMLEEPEAVNEALSRWLELVF